MARTYIKWGKDKVMAQIKEIDRKKEPLTVKYVSKNHTALYSAALRYFGHWMDAVNAAGIDYNTIRRQSRQEAIAKITKWDKNRILREIKSIPKEKLWFVYKTHQALHSAARREYGTWRNAVEAAGYDYDEINQLANTNYTPWTEDKIIRIIRQIPQERLGYGFITKNNILLYSAAYRRFGNWANALKAAGIDPKIIESCRSDKRWDKKKIIEEIGKLHSQGSNLSSGYMQRHHSGLFSAAYRRFGGWGKAIEAAGLDYTKVMRIKSSRYNSL
jgi:hypothetical protein